MHIFSITACLWQTIIRHPALPAFIATANNAQSSKHYATAAVKVGYSQSIWRKYNSLIQTGNFIIVHAACLQPTLKPVLIRQIPKVWQASLTEFNLYHRASHNSGS